MLCLKTDNKNDMTIHRTPHLLRSASSLGLAASLFLFSMPLLAELKPLDAASMSQITGRAGLTIDIESEVTIAEMEYVDAGSMYWRDMRVGGIGGGRTDNIRARVDITDGAETLLTGFADAAWLASLGYLDASETDVAWAIAEYDDGNGSFGKQHGDGDLLIHVSSIDYGLDILTGPVAGQEAANLNAFKHAVDIHFETGSLGIQSSDNLVETDLSRNFSIEAYLGYLDILIVNRGNGFSPTGNDADGQPENVRMQDSYMGIDLKFRVDDLDIDGTNIAHNTFIPRDVTTPGLTLRDMRIHNERGGDTLGSFGFASFETKLAAVTDVYHYMESRGNVETVDGHAIYDINVKMDWDLPHISFGDTGQSIGEVYFTDFHIKDTSLVISAN
ncbi:MAG: hypothetical protein C9356_09880 [Oleiphilus sp.]|nr:MAG: hypothetical protein C9356_09880 [Oleiphilus sp.]